MSQSQTVDHLAPDLRPLTTVELLDSAWTLLRRIWLPCYAASSVGTLPLALLLLVYFQWLGTLVGDVEPGVFYRGTAIWAFAMTLAWVLNGLARGAVTSLALAEARGERLTGGEAWRRSLRHAAGGAFVALFSLSAIYATGVLPGLALAAGWWVSLPALLTEERPFLASLRRSWRLTDGYRGKAFTLWLLFVGCWLIGAANLHLLVHFIVSSAGSFLGWDASALQPHLQWKNQAYATFLLVLLFMLLDPLKSCADALLYLDIRIRREGADLQERLRALRAGAAASAVLLLALAAPSARSQAVKLDEYRARVHALRQQISDAKSPSDVDPSRIRGVRDQLVQMPDGQKLTVENRWVGEKASWANRDEKVRLLRRMDALERSMGGVGASPSQAVPAAGDPKPTVQSILEEPEFQRLAERTELRDLAKGIKVRAPKNWWNSFWDWLKKQFFKPKPPPEPPKLPNWSLPNPGFLQPLLWVLLGGAALFLLALIIRWIIERPVRQGAGAPAATQAPPLEASATENALDHTVDEWELFAQQWLGQGDVRQAIRALYLATLVHLHRERKIDYNRAFTNWAYVRQFRGEVDHKEVLRRLTRAFDEVWYGDRGYGEEQYRSFEQGARALGTPPPGAGYPLGVAARPAHG